MSKVIALAIKDLRLLFRDKAGLFFTLFLPLIYCIFFGAIFSGMYGGGGGSGMDTAVVDEDGTPSSQLFIETLDKAAEINVKTAGRIQALDSVRRGKNVACVIIPKGYGAAMAKPFWGGSPTLELGIDPSRRAEAGMLRGILTQYLYLEIQKNISDTAKLREQLSGALEEVRASEDTDPVTRGALMLFLPALDGFLGSLAQAKDADGDGDGSFAGFPRAKIERIDIARKSKGPLPTNAYQVSFPQGVIWGLLGCAAGFGISLVVERTHGTLVRLRMAPISRAQVLAGKALACFATTVALQAGLFLLARVAFGVQPTSVALLAMAVICGSLGFVGIMMLLSVLGKTEQSAGGIGWAVLLVMAMLGGGMVPLFVMPSWMRTLGNVSPVKWAITAMEGAVWRDFTFAQMLFPCGVLVAVGVVCFTVGVWAFRWTEEG